MTRSQMYHKQNTHKKEKLEFPTLAGGEKSELRGFVDWRSMLGLKEKKKRKEGSTKDIKWNVTEALGHLPLVGMELD